MTKWNHSITAYHRLKLLFAIIIIGFIALVAIHVTLHKLNLAREQSSSQTRMQISLIHHLSEKIKGIQTLYFLWPTIATGSQQQKVHSELSEQLNQIFALIRILEYGGTLPLNLIPPDLAHKKNADKFTLLNPGQQHTPGSISQLRTDLQTIFNDIEELHTMLQNRDRATPPTFVDIQIKDSEIFSALHGRTHNLITTTKEYLAAQQIVITEKQASYERIETVLIFLTIVTIFLLSWWTTRQLIATTNILQDTKLLKEHETKRHQALNAILVISMQKLPLKTQLKQALDILLEIISSKHKNAAGTIFLVDAKAEALTLVVKRGIPEELPCLTSFDDFMACRCGASFQSGEIIQTANNEQCAQCADNQNYYCIPIGPQINTLGVLMLTFSQKTLKAEDITFLKFITPILAGIILQSQYEHRLGKSERATLDIFQGSNQPILLIRDNEIMDWNDGAATLFKAQDLHEFPAAHDLTKLLAQPPAPNTGNSLQEHIDTALTVGVSHGLLTLQKQDTSPFLASLTFTTIPLQGEHIIYLVIQDISAREEEKQALIQARKDAEQASAAKSTFLTTMSHEILTPLNAILGITALTLKDKLSPETRENLEIIQTSSQSLQDLVIDILDISKIEADQFTASAIPFSLRATLKKLEHHFTSTAEEQDLAFHLNIDPNTPDNLIGDPGRLSHVLNKLTVNAFKYTKQGGVEISIRCKDKSTTSCCILFSIQDSGIGIAHSNLENIFNEFTQITTSPANRYGGAGLGLTISKKIVEKMGGTIWATSTPNHGSNFYAEITFPLHKTLYPPGGSAAKQPISIISGKKILVVEDSPINLKVTAQTLHSMGVQTITATNGEEALLAMNSTLDAVLMDVEMPVMDGISATELLRQKPEFDPIPIIAITAHGTDTDKNRCLEVGMNDYMTKPLEPEVLLQVLTRNLNHNSAQGPIDYEKGIARVGGDKDFFLEILHDFAALHGEEGDFLLQLLMEEEFNEIKERAHRLKGVAGTISAQKFAEQAKHLEHLAGAEPIDLIEIEQTIHGVKELIREIINTLEGDT